MRRTTLFSAFALVTTLAFSAAACGGDDDDTADSATEATDGSDTTDDTEASDSTSAGDAGTIVEVASGAGDFTTLVAAVEAAGLVETLSGPGPFTVFAPTDEAFAAALQSLGLTADQLLADTATLQSILTYHVLPAEVPAADITPGEVETVNGATVSLTVGTDGSVMVNDATVVTADVEADNGVIHVIDKVLLPPGA